MIDRACSLNLFDQLIVAIGINPGKKARFSLEERVEMLKSVIQPYPIVSIEPYEGLTAQYAINCGAQTIIRGLREFSDFEREFQMARMNRQIAPEVDTCHSGRPQHSKSAFLFQNSTQPCTKTICHSDETGCCLEVKLGFDV